MVTQFKRTIGKHIPQREREGQGERQNRRSSSASKLRKFSKIGRISRQHSNYQASSSPTHQQRVVGALHVAVVVITSHHLVRWSTVLSRSRLRRVRERQPGGIDDPVVPHQRDRHLRRLAYLRESHKNLIPIIGAHKKQMPYHSCQICENFIQVASSI